MEELKNCPACDSKSLTLTGGAYVVGDDGHIKGDRYIDGQVKCIKCETEAPSKAWQGPRKRVEELEAQLYSAKFRLSARIETSDDKHFIECLDKVLKKKGN